MKGLNADSGEGKEILKIIHGALLEEFKTEEKTQEAMSKLAAIVSEPGAKLLHIDNCVFLVIVRGKTLVEVHTMTIKRDSGALAKAFVKLTKYLKSLGTKLAYTYTNDPKYEIVAKRTKLPFKKQNLQLEDGSQYTAYSVVL